MFMIDMHGTRDFATASSNPRTPGEPYCGSCMARPIRSYSRGSTPFAPAADTWPGSRRESISTGSARPRIGRRTRNPSELMRSASSGRQTSFTECPPNMSFDASSEPYDAPRMRMLRFDIGRLPLFFWLYRSRCSLPHGADNWVAHSEPAMAVSGCATLRLEKRAGQRGLNYERASGAVKHCNMFATAKSPQ